MDEFLGRKGMKETKLGMEENIEGSLCYILGFITGIVFLILEKNSKFVRFHAIQSTITFISLTIIYMIVSPLLWLFRVLISLFWVILWLILMLKAYQNEMYKVPIIGHLAAKQVGL